MGVYLQHCQVCVVGGRGETSPELLQNASRVNSAVYNSDEENSGHFAAAL